MISIATTTTSHSASSCWLVSPKVRRGLENIHRGRLGDRSDASGCPGSQRTPSGLRRMNRSLARLPTSAPTLRHPLGKPCTVPSEGRRSLTGRRFSSVLVSPPRSATLTTYLPPHLLYVYIHVISFSPVLCVILTSDTDPASPT